MYAHKNRRHDRCRICHRRLENRQILMTDFLGQIFEDRFLRTAIALIYQY